jgi:hypothetical protein
MTTRNVDLQVLQLELLDVLSYFGESYYLEDFGAIFL